MIILSVQCSFEPQIFIFNHIKLTHNSGCLQSIKMKYMRGIWRKSGTFLEERRLAVIISCILLKISWTTCRKNCFRPLTRFLLRSYLTSFLQDSYKFVQHSYKFLTSCLWDLSRSFQVLTRFSKILPRSYKVYQDLTTILPRSN